MTSTEFVTLRIFLELVTLEELMQVVMLVTLKQESPSVKRVDRLHKVTFVESLTKKDPLQVLTFVTL